VTRDSAKRRGDLVTAHVTAERASIVDAMVFDRKVMAATRAMMEIEFQCHGTGSIKSCTSPCLSPYLSLPPSQKTSGLSSLSLPRFLFSNLHTASLAAAHVPSVSLAEYLQSFLQHNATRILSLISSHRPSFCSHSSRSCPG